MERKVKIVWTRPQPFTLIFVVISIAVFYYLANKGDLQDPEFMLAHGALYPEAVIKDKEFYRLLTCSFMHFTDKHLLLNMFSLFMVGTYVEKMLGHVKFFFTYLVSAVVCSLVSVYSMVLSKEYVVSVGASGAIFSVIGAALWIFIRNHKIRDFIRGVEMVVVSIVIFVYGILSGILDNWMHMGGLLVGFLFAIIFYRKKNKDESAEDILF